MYPKIFWRDMATTAFEKDTSEWIAVFPLAAIEQHGPHLPVGVDSFIAEGMIARCAEALPTDSCVTFLPLQQVCKSNEHKSFAGTLTLEWDTSVNAWLDIGASLQRAGIKKLVIITSHGGNVAPIEIVARELRQRFGMLVVSTSWGRLGKWQEVYDYGPVVTDIHGGLSETSLMLVFRPDLVNQETATNFRSSQEEMKSNFQHLGWHGSNANAAWLSEDLNPAGVVGDASSASAEKGEEDIQHMVSGFCQLMKEVKTCSAPEGGGNAG